MKRWACAACGADLRGQKAARVAALVLCARPCARVAARSLVRWGAWVTSGAMLTHAFAAELAR